MTSKQDEALSIREIRTMLVDVIKNWNQITSNLTWPEGDSSFAEMDGHVMTLKVVRGHLALVESKLPANEQQSLAARFDESSVQDPHEFAPFADAVKLAIAA